MNGTAVQPSDYASNSGTLTFSASDTTRQITVLVNGDTKFEADEMAEVERMTRAAADAAEMFITSGIEAVMNAYNGGDPATTE